MENTRLLFGITVYHEPPDQLEWCLDNLRKAYPDQPTFVISDGNSAPSFKEISLKYGADYFLGERLKSLENGARWWARFFETVQKYTCDYFFKLDPDTKIYRQFKYFEKYDVFGTARWANVQGGIQCFKNTTAKTILDSKICEDDLYRHPERWSEGGIREYMVSRKEISTDHSLMNMMQKLNLTCGDWKEVDSVWERLGTIQGGVAASHPHKLSLGLNTRQTT